MNYSLKPKSELTIFTSSIFKDTPSKNSISCEHSLIEQYVLKKNNADRNLHFRYLLLYHWYERRYSKNVINENVLKSLYCVYNHENPKDNEIEVEVEKRMLKYLNSEKHIGYSVYYEYYYSFFPDIEKFTFTEFLGIEFFEYFINLFPNIYRIDYLSKKTYFTHRYNRKKKDDYKNYDGNTWFQYLTNRIPSYYPSKKDDFDYKPPTSLISIEKNTIINEVRTERGLPKLGEGWISETKLFYRIKEHFIEFEVVQHGRPNWLGRQHVDIWLHEHSIGIEYQGQQHDRPIEFFGGEKSFEENKKRDERKRMLFKENNAFLIEVREGFDFDLLCEEIKSYIFKKS
jgi:hypothetical protein